jgi:hypothetical protein
VSHVPGRSAEPLHVIFDDSALVAAGHGNVLASALIARAHPDPFQERGPARDSIRIYVAACALVAADRERPGTGHHVAALPNLDVLPLDLPAALDVMGAADWAVPHTRYAAQPSLEMPDGAVVATARPERWQGQPVRVLDLNP